jgi:hypothetical protein
MIIKAVSLFLIGMLVLAMFGKLRLTKRKPPPEITKTKLCKKCGAIVSKSSPCDCTTR